MSGLVLLGLRFLAAIALYAFLGGALFLLWRSLKQDAQALSSRQITPIDLLISMPDLDDNHSHFTQSSVVIGRDPDCDCILAHNTVSGRHARLAYHHAQWWVDDLLSTNGTNLNGEALQMPTVVTNGDTITCGQITLTVIFKSETQPDTGE
ncbi:MAG: FHA domain-containing protein [Chloroflexi bacterium]|nr:FHA domain-containing protein [Chloroflexota bacterium]